MRDVGHNKVAVFNFRSLRQDVLGFFTGIDDVVSQGSADLGCVGHTVGGDTSVVCNLDGFQFPDRLELTIELLPQIIGFLLVQVERCELYEMIEDFLRDFFGQNALRSQDGDIVLAARGMVKGACYNRATLLAHNYVWRKRCRIKKAAKPGRPWTCLPSMR